MRDNSDTVDLRPYIAPVMDSSQLPSTPKQTNLRVGTPPPTDPFPYKNFGLCGRDRPFVNLSPFSPVTWVDPTTPKVREEEQGSRDQHMGNTSAADARQLVLQSGNGDTSMATLSPDDVFKGHEAPKDPHNVSYQPQKQIEGSEASRVPSMASNHLLGLPRNTSQTFSFPRQPDSESLQIPQMADQFSIPPPSPEDGLRDALTSLGSKSGDLQDAIHCFRKAIQSGDASGYQQPAGAIDAWLSNAEQELDPCTCFSQYVHEIHLLDWVQTLNFFYGEMQPYGYVFGAYGDQELLRFIDNIYYFGLRMGLAFDPLNFIQPEAPPTDASRQSALTRKSEEGLPEVASSETLGPKQAEAPPKNAVQQPEAAETPKEGPQHAPSPKPLSIDFTYGTSPANYRFASRPAAPPRHRSNVLPRHRSNAPTEAEKSKGYAVIDPPKIQRGEGPLNFYDLNSLYPLSIQELAEITPKSFGWDQRKIWSYTGNGDLGPELSKNKSSENAMVKFKLEALAPAFKRALVVLRFQARTDKPKDYTATPSTLLGNVYRLIVDANQMRLDCSAMKVEDCESWKEWRKACVFFHEEIFGNNEIVRGLIKQYGVEQWAALEKIWVQRNAQGPRMYWVPLASDPPIDTSLEDEIAGKRLLLLKLSHANILLAAFS